MRVDHDLLIGLLGVAALVAAFLGAQVDYLEDALPFLLLPVGSCGTGGLFALGPGLHLDV